MMEVLHTEATGERPSADVEEVLNYVAALRWGLDERARLPVSERLMREMHRRLMAGVCGRERSPGELHTTQNWVGAAGLTVETAHFVPPPPDELGRLLPDWEMFAHHRSPAMPVLLQNALLHYPFETLHRFSTATGGVGGSSSCSPNAVRTSACGHTEGSVRGIARARTETCLTPRHRPSRASEEPPVYR